MAASATTGTYTPGDTGAKLQVEAWQKTIEDAVYEDAKLYPVATERDRLYSKLHIRKFSTFSASTYAQTDPANPTAAFAYSANTEVEVTITPGGSIVAVLYSENQLVQMDQSPEAQWKRNLENCLAQSIDLAFATNANSLVTNIRGAGVGEDLSKALMMSGIGALRTSAKSEWDYPNGKPAYLAIHTAQLDDLGSIPEFMNANFRGDTKNPNVKGLGLEALGLNIIISGNVYVDGVNVAHNLLWVPSAIGISFNAKTNVRVQQFDLSHKFIAYANYGTNIVWDERAVDIRTNSS